MKKGLWNLAVMLIAVLVPYSAFTAGLYSEELTLKNGMRIIVIPNHKVPAVTHMVWYRHGSTADPAGKSGIAHFLEHLMFKATKTLTSGEFSSRIAKNGGNDNAFTSYDYTTYFQTIAVEKLPMVMALEADRMRNIVFSEAEVTKERAVILEERSMRIDNEPLSQLQESMRAALFLNHPYGRPIIGWRHEMEQLTLDDAKRFYAQHYTASHATVIVAGDITLTQLKPLAEKYYGPLPKGRVYPETQVTEPAHVAARHVTLRDRKISAPEWMRYYISPSIRIENLRDGMALMVLAHLLGGEGTGQLYQALVETQKKASMLSVSYDGLNRGPSIFAIRAIPTPGSDIHVLEEAIDKEISNIQHKGFRIEDVERAKWLLKADSIYARDSFETLAFLFGHVIASGLPRSYLDNWDHYVDAITLEDVTRVANTVLTREKSVTGWLLPDVKPPLSKKRS